MTPAPLRAAVFLDRDGVLNRTFVRDGVPHPPAGPAEVQILPGVAEALASLAAAGLVLVGVSNQPDVARGTQSRAVVEQINALLQRQLPLQAIYTCYHDNADDCACRKPRPGLILQAAADYNIDVGRSFMVGDRWSDVAAGRTAGCKTFLICLAYSQKERCTPDFTVGDLPEAARLILDLVRSSEGR